MGWAYSVARIRALETRLVDKSKVTRILDAESLEDALKVLQETEYGAYMSSLHSGQGREDAFASELARVYHIVSDMVPEDWPVSLLRARYDYHNLKVALMASLTGQEPSPAAFSTLGRVAPEAVLEAVRSGNTIDLPGDMRMAAATARAAYDETGRLVVLDGVLDRAMFDYCVGHTPPAKGHFLRGYFARLADIVNLRATMRARAMGLNAEALSSMLVPGGLIARDRFMAAYSGPPEGLADVFQSTDYAGMLAEGIKRYAEDGVLSVFERDSDNFLIEYLKVAKYVAFGPEPVISYLLAKENEVQTLRMLFIGKANGLAREAVRERLRDTYV